MRAFSTPRRRDARAEKDDDAARKTKRNKISEHVLDKPTKH